MLLYTPSQIAFAAIYDVCKNTENFRRALEKLVEVQTGKTVDELTEILQVKNLKNKIMKKISKKQKKLTKNKNKKIYKKFTKNLQKI